MWYRYKEDHSVLVLSLYIQPGASKTEVAGIFDGALKIKVAAPANEHQANDKLLEFLRKSYKVRKNQVILTHGEHARQKIVEIIAPNTVADILYPAG